MASEAQEILRKSGLDVNGNHLKKKGRGKKAKYVLPEEEPKGPSAADILKKSGIGWDGGKYDKNNTYAAAFEKAMADNKALQERQAAKQAANAGTGTQTTEAGGAAPSPAAGVGSSTGMPADAVREDGNGFGQFLRDTFHAQPTGVAGGMPGGLQLPQADTGSGNGFGRFLHDTFGAKPVGAAGGLQAGIGANGEAADPNLGIAGMSGPDALGGSRNTPGAGTAAGIAGEDRPRARITAGAAGGINLDAVKEPEWWTNYKAKLASPEKETIQAGQFSGMSREDIDKRIRELNEERVQATVDLDTDRMNEIDEELRELRVQGLMTESGWIDEKYNAAQSTEQESQATLQAQLKAIEQQMEPYLAERQQAAVDLDTDTMNEIDRKLKVLEQQRDELQKKIDEYKPQTRLSDDETEAVKRIAEQKANDIDADIERLAAIAGVSKETLIQKMNSFDDSLWPLIAVMDEQQRAAFEQGLQNMQDDHKELQRYAEVLGNDSDTFLEAMGHAFGSGFWDVMGGYAGTVGWVQEAAGELREVFGYDGSGAKQAAATTYAAAKETQEKRDALLQQAKQNAGQFQSICADLVQNGTTMGADTLAMLYGSGIGLTSIVASEALSLGNMALRIFGSTNVSLLDGQTAYDEFGNVVAHNDVSFLRRTLGAAVAAGVEIATERMFDGLGGLYGQGLAKAGKNAGSYAGMELFDIFRNRMVASISNVAKRPAAAGVLSVFFGGLGESVEEGISGFAEPVTNLITMDKNTWLANYGISKDASWIEAIAKAEWNSKGEIAYSMLIGGLMGMLGSANPVQVNQVYQTQRMGEVTRGIDPEKLNAFFSGEKPLSMVINEDARKMLAGMGVETDAGIDIFGTMALADLYHAGEELGIKLPTEAELMAKVDTGDKANENIDSAAEEAQTEEAEQGPVEEAAAEDATINAETETINAEDESINAEDDIINENIDAQEQPLPNLNEQQQAAEEAAAQAFGTDTMQTEAGMQNTDVDAGNMDLRSMEIEDIDYAVQDMLTANPNGGTIGEYQIAVRQMGQGGRTEVRVINPITGEERSGRAAPKNATKRAAEIIYDMEREMEAYERANVSNGRQERQTGEYTEERAGSVPAEKSAIIQQAKADQRRSRAGNYPERTAAELIPGIGSESAKVRVIPTHEYDSELKRLDSEIYNKTGKRPIFVIGQIEIADGDGNTGHANGYYSPDGQIVVRADYKWSATQIAKHELFHWMCDNDPTLEAKAVKVLKIAMSEEQYNALRDSYKAEYEEYSGDMDPDIYVQQEIAADCYAGVLDRTEYNIPQDAIDAVTELMDEREQSRQAQGENMDNGPGYGEESQLPEYEAEDESQITEYEDDGGQYAQEAEQDEQDVEQDEPVKAPELRKLNEETANAAEEEKPVEAPKLRELENGNKKTASDETDENSIGEDVATSDVTKLRNLIPATIKQIRNYIRKALEDTNKFKYLKISDVTDELAEILKAEGIDIAGLPHVLSDNSIRHIDISHGSKSNDKYKVGEKEFNSVNDIINGYTNLYLGYDTKTGNKTIVYEKVDGQRIFYVEEVLEKNGLSSIQMLIVGKTRKPSFLKKMKKIASKTSDTGVTAQGRSTSQSSPSKHVQDANVNTDYSNTIAPVNNSVKTENAADADMVKNLQMPAVKEYGAATELMREVNEAESDYMRRVQKKVRALSDQKLRDAFNDLRKVTETNGEKWLYTRLQEQLINRGQIITDEFFKKQSFDGKGNFFVEDYKKLFESVDTRKMRYTAEDVRSIAAEKGEAGLDEMIRMLPEVKHEELRQLANTGNMKNIHEPASGKFRNAVDEEHDRRINELIERLNGKRAAKEAEKSAPKKQAKKPTVKLSDEGPTELKAPNGSSSAIVDKGQGRFSLSTYDMKGGGREQLKAYLDQRVKANKLSSTEAKQMMQQMEEYYDLCKQYKNKYAPFAKWSDAKVVIDQTTGLPAFSVVKANAEYKMNLDFSLICKKRRTLDAVFNEMVKSGIMDDFEMKEGSIAAINDIIRQFDFETACALCFVDTKRYRQALVADSFTDLYNGLVRSMMKDGQHADFFNFGGDSRFTPSGDGINTLDDSELDFTLIDEILKDTDKSGTVPYKIAKNLKEHPEDRQFVLRGDFMSSAGFDNIKATNSRVLGLYNSKKGAGGPKAAQSDVQYLNDILHNKVFDRKKAYAVGGVRIQSFSDYVPRLVFDYLQMFADLAATNMPAHAYTKEALYVMQFGLTGARQNMSLVPEIVKNGVAPGLDENGDYAWKDGQSFGSTEYAGNAAFVKHCLKLIGVEYNGQKRLTAQQGYELAKVIQNTEGYNLYCGTIAVGVSDAHIDKMLDDPNIRMIIPYHASSLNHIVAVMTNIEAYTDYTDVQNTRRIGDSGKPVKISKEQDTFNYNEALQEAKGDGRKAADAYLAWCEENGFIPKFDDFADHPNYYKLLEDFDTYDMDGTASMQGDVKLNLPGEDGPLGSFASLVEMGLEEDALLQAKQDEDVPKIIDAIKKTLPSLEEKMDTRTDELERAEKALESAEKSIATNEKRVAAAEQALEAARAAYEAEPIKKNETRVKNKTNSLERAREKLQKAHDYLETKREELDKAKGELMTPNVRGRMSLNSKQADSMNKLDGKAEKGYAQENSPEMQERVNTAIEMYRSGKTPSQIYNATKLFTFADGTLRDMQTGEVVGNAKGRTVGEDGKIFAGGNPTGLLDSGDTGNVKGRTENALERRKQTEGRKRPKYENLTRKQINEIAKITDEAIKRIYNNYLLNNQEDSAEEFMKIFRKFNRKKLAERLYRSIENGAAGIETVLHDVDYGDLVEQFDKAVGYDGPRYSLNTNQAASQNFDPVEYMRAAREREAYSNDRDEFIGTDHLETLGIKIAGSEADYDHLQQLKMGLDAAKRSSREIAKLERRLRPSEGEKQFARGIASGIYDGTTIPSGLNRNTIEELVDAYRAEATLGPAMLKKRKATLQTKLDDKMASVFLNADTKHIPKVLTLNFRTPARIMRQLFGDKEGTAIYESIFLPVEQNTAERDRFRQRMYDAVEKFTGSDGKQSKLTKNEAKVVQMMLENSHADVLVREMEMSGNNIDTRRAGLIRDAVEKIKAGESINDVLKEYNRDEQTRALVEQLVKYEEAQRIITDNEFDQTKLDNAAAEYREQFSRFYDAINDVLLAHGYEPIGFIKGYAPHMQPETVQTTLQKALSALGVTEDVGNLPTEIAGITGEFKPNKRWNPYFLQRNGDRTDYDLIHAYESYVDYMSDVIYHIDDIMRIRAVERYFRETYSNGNIAELIDDAKEILNAPLQRKLDFLRKNGKLTGNSILDEDGANEAIRNFISDQYAMFDETSVHGGLVTWLKNYGNKLAAKQLSYDRATEDLVGRKALNFANKLNKAFAMSQVGAKMTSVLNQGAQLPQIYAELGGKWFARAIKDVRLGGLRHSEWALGSDFIVGKNGVDTIAPDIPSMIVNKMFAPADFVDGYLSTVAVRGRYLKALDEGMSPKEAMKTADRFASEIMGSRMLGVKPLGFESKNPVIRMATIFQIEALNTWEHISQDLPRDFRIIEEKYGRKTAAMSLAGVIIKALLAAFTLNRLDDELYGGSPAPFDILGLTANFIASGNGLRTNDMMEMLIDDAWEAATGEKLFGLDDSRLHDDEFKWKQAALSTAENITNDIPFIRNLSSLLGMGDSSLPFAGSNMRDVIDKVKGDSYKPWGDILRNVVLGFVPGGAQVNKTLQGVEALRSGGDYSTNGNLKYAFDTSDPMTVARLLAFGKYATPEAQRYFAELDYSGKTSNALTGNKMSAYEMALQGGMATQDAEKAIRSAWDAAKAASVDKDGNQSSSINQAGAKAALDDMDIPNDLKAILWQCMNKSWKGDKNPYNTRVGNQVYDFLNGKNGNDVTALWLPELG